MLPFLLHLILLCLSFISWALLTAVCYLLLRYCRRNRESLVAGIIAVALWGVTTFNVWYEGVVQLQRTSLLSTFNSWVFVLVTPLFYLYYRLRLTGYVPGRRDWVRHLLLPAGLLLGYVGMAVVSPVPDRLLYSWHDLLPQLFTWWGVFRLSCFALLVGQLCVYLPRLLRCAGTLRREILSILLFCFVAALCICTPFFLFHLLYTLSLVWVALYLFLSSPICRLLKRRLNHYIATDFPKGHALARSQECRPNPCFCDCPSSAAPSDAAPEEADLVLAPEEATLIEATLRLHLSNPNLTIVLLAREVGSNETYLSRYFNRQRKTSFSEYISACRVDEAEKLLRETDATVTEVVDRAGFKSSSSFYKAFKDRHQIPPLEWRSQLPPRLSSF